VSSSAWRQRRAVLASIGSSRSGEVARRSGSTSRADNMRGEVGMVSWPAQWLRHRSLPQFAPLGGMGCKGRSGRKGGEGMIGASIDVPRVQMGLLFHPTTPALAAATISKMPVKPLPPPPASSGVRKANSLRLFRIPLGTLATLRTHSSPATDTYPTNH
jgi:hypothetical protein